jgi:predicted nucleic acid-binding protein
MGRSTTSESIAPIRSERTANGSRNATSGTVLSYVDESQQLATNFWADLATGIYQRLPIEAIHYQIAETWISQFSTVLRTLDALHLATANAAQIRLVTGDIGLAQSAQILGLAVDLILP